MGGDARVEPDSPRTMLGRIPEMTHQRKITFGEMRDSGVCGVLINCSDFKCSRSTAISADRWPNEIRLSDIELQFVCRACGQRGADIRPDFNWRAYAVGGIGYSST